MIHTVAGPGEAAQRRGQLGAWRLLLGALYAVPAFALSFPHLSSDGWRIATAVVGVGTAVITALFVASKRPAALTPAERRYATLDAVSYSSVAVVLFLVFVGAGNLFVWVVQRFWDVELPWVRALAAIGFLAMIPASAGAGYDETWRPQLVERAPGVPTGWAHFDPGQRVWSNDRVRFAIHTVVLIAAIAVTLTFRTWWVTIAASTIVLVLASSLAPVSSKEPVAASLDDAKAAFEELGYTIEPAGDLGVPITDQASVNPLIQTVDFRAVRTPHELAVSVYDQKSPPVDWGVASRLVAAARAIGWSNPTSDARTSSVLPVMVLVDAARDASLDQFAADEQIAIVNVSTTANTSSTSGEGSTAELADVGQSILRSLSAHG
jgi:hypothetical protein